MTRMILRLMVAALLVWAGVALATRPQASSKPVNSCSGCPAWAQNCAGSKRPLPCRSNAENLQPQGGQHHD